jgi:ABC-type glycerol-3-phosphate transport system permease component
MSAVRRYWAHWVFGGLVAFAVVAPLGFAAYTGLRTGAAYNRDPVWPPGELSLDNFRRVWDDPALTRWFGNSLLLSLGSALISLAVSAMAAFGFALGRLPGKALIFNAVVGLMIVPLVVLVVPLFRLDIKLGLQDSYLPSLVIYAAVLTPFSTYVLTRVFENVPTELREAGSMDGATPGAIFRYIFLPLARPALVILAIVNAVWVWNEILVALVFLDDEHRTIMAGLATLAGGAARLDVPFVFAALVTASLPIVVLYLAAQGFLARGFSQSGIKG